MGDVLAIFKIYPEDMEKFEYIKKAIENVIPEGAQLVDVKEEPIGFGFSAIKVGVRMPDKGGILDRVEEALRNVEGVESVELEGATLI